MISMRNNIIVHNDWAAISPTIGPGKNTILVSQITRDVYFENNTVAYNKSSNVISIQRRPPLARFSNFWFRNNIFWGNSGPVSIASGLDTSGIHFQNNLWDKPYQGDKRARTGDPAFVDPAASSPEGYRLKSSSAAIDAGMVLYENPLDFWNGQRPHLPKAGTTKEPNPKTGFYVLPKEGKYDIGAVEAGTNGKAHIGLDLSKFPFEVTPFKLQFKAKPQR
jgi:hypothetical protein